MDFSLTEEQEILKKFARDFLSSKYTLKVIKELENGDGHSPEIWQEIAALGWLGLPFAEDYGGAGMSFLDLCVLLEEMGMACMISPYFADVVLGGLCISDYASDEQKRKYLSSLATGEKIFTLALFEDDGVFNAASVKTTAEFRDGNWIVSGSKLFVPYAHIADFLICVARTGNTAKPEKDITIFIIDKKTPGVQCTLHNTRTDKLSKLKFNSVVVEEKNILGHLNNGWDIVSGTMDKAIIARCFEAVGLSQKVLDMSVDYAKERQQFGHPIATFQPIQQYCADMLTDIYGMRVSSFHAASILNRKIQCLPQIAVAASWAVPSIERIINAAHQIHGAMGFTLDYNLHYYTRRLKSAQVYLDINKTYRDIIARQIGINSEIN